MTFEVEESMGGLQIAVSDHPGADATKSTDEEYHDDIYEW